MTDTNPRFVQRDEILDWVTYVEQRDSIRDAALAAKRDRRIHLGEHLTFLFENKTTTRYQVQEMMRVEQIVKEADIVHELETYNELLGAEGELGCTLLIEIDDVDLRNERLTAMVDLPRQLYIRTDAGHRVPAQFDERQVGDDRLSSVQYLKFALGDAKPVAIGAEHAALTAEVELSEGQRAALMTDLIGQ